MDLPEGRKHKHGGLEQEQGGILQPGACAGTASKHTAQPQDHLYSKQQHNIQDEGQYFCCFFSGF